MKNIIIIFAFLFAFMQTSCGSKKKVVERKKESTVYTEKKDVQTNVKNDITANVSIVKTSVKTTIEPKDESKESSYNGIPFKNAKITKEETAEEVNTEIKDNSEVDLSDNTNTDFKDESEALNKDIDKDNSFNVFDWLWLFIAIAVVLFAIRLYVKKINPLTWLKDRVVK
ncbi:hypothetical protein [Joostella sp.]|uniref:hypothetical protein n=1 Tax=Joostella sp. TaxID=2231138 RepID=UPI003A8D7F63